MDNIRGRELFGTPPTSSTTAVTGTNTYYSHVLVKEQVKDLLIVFKFTETIAALGGTLTLWVANESAETFKQAFGKDSFLAGGTFVNALLWTQYNPTGFSIAAIAGTTTDGIKVTDLGAQMMRLRYVNATGSGTGRAQVGGQ